MPKFNSVRSPRKIYEQRTTYEATFGKLLLAFVYCVYACSLSFMSFVQSLGRN